MTKNNTKANVLILILFIGLSSSVGLSLKINNDLSKQIEVNADITAQLKVSNKAIKDLDKKIVKFEEENKEQQTATEKKDAKIVEQDSKIDSLIEESKKKDSEISDLISKKEQEEQDELVATSQESEIENQSTEVKEESVDTAKETLTVEATAYSTNQPSMSNLTYTEINLDVNPDVIAVDPSFIPLGSTVYIKGYGTFIAGDTGGDINGNRIDIHMTNLDNAVAFGRKTMEVVVTN